MIEEIRSALKPPYQTRDVYTLFAVFFIMITIPLTVLQVTTDTNQQVSASITHTQTTSNTESKPTVAIKNLAANTNISGILNLLVEASDQEASITRIDILIDDEPFSTIHNPALSKSFESMVSWNTAKEANGERTIKTTATNSLGVSSSTQVSVTVVNQDSEAPTVSFLQLRDGSYISEENKQIKIEAFDNNGIDRVELYFDDKLVAESQQPPFQFGWDNANDKVGTHRLSAVAYDFVGNKTVATINVYRGTKNIVAN